MVLVDDDEEARRLQLRLKVELNLRPGEQLLHYGDLFDEPFDWEAEDLFPASTLEAWLAEVGQELVDGTRRRPDGSWHVDLSQEGKAELAEWVQHRCGTADLARFVEVLDVVHVALDRQAKRARKRAAHHEER